MHPKTARMTNGFTPTQILMLGVLADGMRHTFGELHACLRDELGARENIFRHLSAIRKVIRPLGNDIICEYWERRKYYRHIRLLRKIYSKPKA